MKGCIKILTTAAVLLLTFDMEARAADVPYISGGTGADARQELLAKERDYNLKIIAADKSGDYLAHVGVVIESAGKERVLDTTMDGPILLAKLAPGTYTIRATSDARTLTRTVTIAARGLRQADFRWDVSR
jgi:hydrogenase maturation factor